MTLLGTLQLRHRNSIYAVRAKLYNLAEALGFDVIASTRLSTAVSDMARSLYQSSLDSSISIALLDDARPPRLVLDFCSPAQCLDGARWSAFFDSLQRLPNPGAVDSLRALTTAPEQGLVVDESLCASLRQLLLQRSREELIEEVEQQNRNLEQHSLQLEDTVAQRTEQLEQAMQEADTANKAKGDFLANMSHEIRTPMNAIIGLSDLCLRTEMSDKQRDYLVKVNNSAKSLLGIINDILDFSKIEAGKMDIEQVPFAIDAVMENLSTLIAGRAQEKGLELLFNVSPEVPEQLLGDPLRLGQVLVNLASNAVKFTEQGEVLVSVDVQELSGQQGELSLHCTVKDSGIGMSGDQIDKLFQSFSQADTSTTRRYGGTGLGLAISRQLVQMMGGDISVASAPGEGSCFTFDIKVSPGDPQPAQRRYADARHLQGLRCLVVDDNASSRHILARYLQAFGFSVETEASAGAVLERTGRDDFDFELIVSDWSMPGLTGIEMAAQLRAQQLKKQPKIIVVSAYDSIELKHEQGADKVDRFLAKPINPSGLFDAVMDCLGASFSTDSSPQSLGDSGDKLAALHGVSVLLVEDNAINQQVASELLQHAGMVVAIANHGAEAIEMLNDSEYDVVLMDVQMPVMDGYTATRQLREQSRFDALPILAMTANATAEDSQKSLDAGMNAHINKPIDPEQLFVELLAWVRPSRSLQPDTIPLPIQTAATDEAGIPQLAGMDCKAGVARVGGSVAAYLRLLEKFVSNQASSGQEIRHAVERDDQEQVILLAHSLKGAAGALGVIEVQAQAGIVENLAGQGLAAVESAVLAELEAQLDGAVLTIRGVLPQRGNAPPAASVDPAIPLESVLERLSVLQRELEDYDAEAEDTLNVLRAELAGSALLAELEPVASLVAAYELESAAQQLQQITLKLEEQIGEH